MDFSHCNMCCLTIDFTSKTREISLELFFVLAYYLLKGKKASYVFTLSLKKAQTEI